MDCSNWLLLSVSLVAAFSAELSFACFGFGAAILYEISWQLCAAVGITGGSLEAAVANTVVLAIPSALIQIVTLWEHRRWKLVALCCIPYACVLPVGTLVLEGWGTSVHMKQALGLLFLVIGCLQIMQRRRAKASRDEGKEDVFDLPELEALGASAVMASVFAFGASGLMRGAFGVSGPPLMVLIMYFLVDKDVWRFLSAVLRLLTIILQGYQLARHGDFHSDCWRLYLVLLGGGLTGLMFGKCLIAPTLNVGSFQTWISLYLVSGALLMLCAGNVVLSYIASILVMSVLVASAAVPCWDAVRTNSFSASSREALVIEMGWQPSAVARPGLA